MKGLKSERHHCWPVCVSELWSDEQGGIHRLSPDGTIRRAAPRNFGVIGNGHTVKLSHDPSETTPFDECFESEFQDADSNFRSVIEFLYQICPDNSGFSELNPDRIRPHHISDDMFNRIPSCVISLAVRSPLFRERSVRLVEGLRGPLPERERNMLIGSNIRNAFKDTVREVGGHGVLLSVHSEEAEFIFGDGFYNDIPIPVQYISNMTLFSPLTPSLAVLYARRPSQVIAERLFSIHISKEETEFLNNSIHVYSRREIFYRSQRPPVSPAFASGEHLRYSDDDNPVDRLVSMIPVFRDYFAELFAIKRGLWWLL